MPKLRYSENSLEAINRPVETAGMNGKEYNVELLRPYAESLPVVQMPLENFVSDVSESNKCWTDSFGQRFGPYQILEDWEAAQRNIDWEDHIKAIKEADLNEPVWFHEGDGVFDGLHRLTRAFLEKKQSIPVKVWDIIPDFTSVKDRVKDE